MQKTTSWKLIAGAVVMALAVPACVVNEPEAPTRGVVVSGPPPAPVAERPPPAPNPQAVWIPGYWHWTGMQYAWIPGHWDAAPPGRAWSGPVYSVRDGQYFYESGGWRPAAGGGAPVPEAPRSRNAIR